MTAEERQLRAWVRTVFRHAALRWLAQERRHQGTIAVGDREEALTWPSTEASVVDAAQEVHLNAVTWLADCWPRLTVAERELADGLSQGMTGIELARSLQCTPRTIRRMRHRIRRRCPL